VPSLGRCCNSNGCTGIRVWGVDGLSAAEADHSVGPCCGSCALLGFVCLSGSSARSKLHCVCAWEGVVAQGRLPGRGLCGAGLSCLHAGCCTLCVAACASQVGAVSSHESCSVLGAPELWEGLDVAWLGCREGDRLLGCVLMGCVLIVHVTDGNPSVFLAWMRLPCMCCACQQASAWMRAMQC
jgi:hypothetical protein